jgi:hypothetical protein
MARRSEFKGIVRNFAHMLNSRNNDFLGYWATGQLYFNAEQEEVTSISLNLLKVESQLSSKTLEAFANNMLHFFVEMLTAHKIPLSWVKSAFVIFSFDQPYQKQYHYRRSALGKPYLLTLEITSDLGKL